MNPLYMGLILAFLASIMPLIGKALKGKRAGKEKYQKIMADFQQQVDGALMEGEHVDAMCGYVPCAAVTNKRLLMGTKNGIERVEFHEIRSLKGIDASGSKTSNPEQMMGFTIKANKKYVLGNHSEGFDQVVTLLFIRTGK